MARPRIFISSTFYDLRYIRSSLEGFINSLGYEPVLSEKGQIAYDPDIPLDESCYRDASNADILVLIVGGRYGSWASEEKLEEKPDFYERYKSITKKEFESAIRRDIPIYILIDRTVMGEYETFCKNRKNTSIEYAHVDSVNVFYLIEDVTNMRRNNPVHFFDHPNEIEEWLRSQWAGLFREMLAHRSEQKQIASLSERISELASINISLQRYLEAVVARVSSSPEEARDIIEKENERLIDAKILREFEKNELVSELIDLFKVDPDKVREMYENAKTIDDIAFKTAKAINDEPSRILEYWKKEEHIKLWVNQAREILKLPQLEFKKNKK